MLRKRRKIPVLRCASVMLADTRKSLGEKETELEKAYKRIAQLEKELLEAKRGVMRQKSYKDAGIPVAPNQGSGRLAPSGSAPQQEDPKSSACVLL